MKKIIDINDFKYRIVKNYKDKFNLDLVCKKWTDYFEIYDYIVGDFAYDKLRLKGFCKKENPNFKDLNDEKGIKSYIKKDCAYECAYFILERINDLHDKK